MATGIEVQSAKQRKPKRRGGHDSSGSTTSESFVTRLARKLHDVERRISQVKGTFELFALIGREQAEGWEVVAAATWLDTGLAGSTYMAGQLQKVLSSSEMTKLSGVVLLKHDSPFVNAFQDELTDEVRGSAKRELRNVVVSGVAISRALVFTAKPRRPSRVP